MECLEYYDIRDKNYIKNWIEKQPHSKDIQYGLKKLAELWEGGTLRLYITKKSSLPLIAFPMKTTEREDSKRVRDFLMESNVIGYLHHSYQTLYDPSLPIEEYALYAEEF